MGSYGSLGSAEPYGQAGSESAVQAAIGGSIDNIYKKKKNYYENDQNNEGVYYHNGNIIDNRPYRPNN